MKVIIPYFILSILALSSCKKQSLINEVTQTEDFAEIFHSFWTQMNLNYVYWGYDVTNWDQTYVTYAPIFKKLDIHNKNDVKKSVQYFREMTDSLVDGHYNISFQNIDIKDSIIFPTLEHKSKASYFHDAYPYFSVDKKYLDTNYVSGYNYLSIPNPLTLFAVSGTIKDKVLYFYCSNFYLSKSYNSPTDNGIKSVIDNFTENLHHNKNIRGVILDVRSNSGGSISDLDFLVGEFIDRPLNFGYIKYKIGEQRLDYSPWLNATVHPKTSKEFDLPIIILGDIFSASMSETIILSVQTLPSGLFIGENTWGATGPITENNIYNSGQFSVGNFMHVETSSAVFKTLGGAIRERIGINPDIYIPFEKDLLNNGSDNQLEKAISLIVK